jgi:hypothetical protein
MKGGLAYRSISNPIVDRNPQPFANIYECGEEDFVKATMRVYHSAEKASCLKVGVMR